MPPVQVVPDNQLSLSPSLIKEGLRNGIHFTDITIFLNYWFLKASCSNPNDDRNDGIRDVLSKNIIKMRKLKILIEK